MSINKDVLSDDFNTGTNSPPANLWYNGRGIGASQMELDEQTLERAKLLAESRKCTLPELIAEIIKLLAAPKVAKDPWMGLLADEPELVDEILEEALRNRLSFEAG